MRSNLFSNLFRQTPNNIQDGNILNDPYSVPSQYSLNYHNAFKLIKPAIFNSEKFPILPCHLNSFPNEVKTDLAELKPEDQLPKEIEVSKKMELLNSSIKKAIRAEKNRKFAKESRERKRKYIQSLEMEVKELKIQLEFYRQKLQKYELIENGIISFGDEIKTTLVDACTQMNVVNQPITNNSLFSEILKERLRKKFIEQRMALEQLTKMMMSALLANSVKVSRWVAENNIDIYDSKKIEDHIESRCILAFSHCIRQSYPDRKSHNDVQSYISSIGSRLKSLMYRILECQNQAQAELISLENYMKENVAPKFTIQQIEILAQMIPFFNSIPELKDHTIYQYKETKKDIEDKLIRN